MMTEVKIFKVVGEIRKPNLETSFRKEVAALKPENAVEKIYSEIGSKHRVKRFHIKIFEVKEVPPDKVEDLQLKKLVMGETEDATLEASERAVEAILKVPGVITPFPGGLCRSGSKVGSTYAFLRASTNTPFCPAIKHTFPDSQIPEGVNSVIEVVLNGLDEPSVKEAMAVGIKAATEVPGIKWITAVNFGGKLGKFQIGLKDALGVE